jgi:hypothetical protein
MSYLQSVLAGLVTWLRAGYPQHATEHGYIPLIALMPATARTDGAPRAIGTNDTA